VTVHREHKVKRENQQDATNSMAIIKLLSQHVSGIIMSIIRRIRPCPNACGVLLGCVGCGARSSRHSSTRPQPTTTYTPKQNTACIRTRSYSPDDGHNDARNMLREKFDDKHRISCILLVLSLHLKEFEITGLSLL